MMMVVPVTATRSCWRYVVYDHDHHHHHHDRRHPGKDWQSAHNPVRLENTSL